MAVAMMKVIKQRCHFPICLSCAFQSIRSFKSNGVDVWLVFFPYVVIYTCVKVLHFKSYWKIIGRKRTIVCVCAWVFYHLWTIWSETNK